MKDYHGEYQHSQRGILQPILLITAAACLGLGLFLNPKPPAMIICLAVAGACIILASAMAYLAVTDCGDHLLIRFGPLPLFRKKIFYSDISAVETGRSNFLSG